MMSTDRIPASRGNRRSEPTQRNSCGSTAGAQRHYKSGELLCEDCAFAHAEATRRYNALKHGHHEFGKLPSQQWVFDEPFETWRLLQTKEFEDGTYIAGPWYRKIRVPLTDLPEPELDADRQIVFQNGSALYEFRHRDNDFIYLELNRRSLKPWIEVIEEKYL